MDVLRQQACRLVRFTLAFCLLVAGSCTIRQKGNTELRTEEGPFPDGDCALAKGLACTFLGQTALRRFQAKESENDAVRAITWLSKGCRFHDWQGCLEWGKFLQRFNTEPGLVKQGRVLIELSCKQGLPDGCATLGEQFKDGISGPGSRARAMELFVMACEMGSPRGCYQQGTSDFSGWGGPVDLGRARDLHRIGCDGGVAEACLGSAGMMFRGEGGPEDDDEASRLADRACELGLKYACLGDEDESADSSDSDDAGE